MFDFGDRLLPIILKSYARQTGIPVGFNLLIFGFKLNIFLLLKQVKFSYLSLIFRIEPKSK